MLKLMMQIYAALQNCKQELIKIFKFFKISDWNVPGIFGCNVFGDNRSTGVNLQGQIFCLSINMKIKYSKSITYMVFKILLLSLAGSIYLGCKSDKERIIQQKVAENLQDFRKKKSQECSEILLREAEEIVDSLLLAEATDAMQDSLGRLRPGRPMQPPSIPPIDSMQVHPLFDLLPPIPDTGKKG
jgi:hypothetical protein